MSEKPKIHHKPGAKPAEGTKAKHKPYEDKSSLRKACEYITKAVKAGVLAAGIASQAMNMMGCAGRTGLQEDEMATVDNGKHDTGTVDAGHGGCMGVDAGPGGCMGVDAGPCMGVDAGGGCMGVDAGPCMGVDAGGSKGIDIDAGGSKPDGSMPG